MGGRGSFVDVNTNNFAFVDNGQTYFTIGSIGEDIRVLERPKGSVNAPDYSHTGNRIYAIVQKGELKHIAYYDENHNFVKSIDFLHSHEGEQPHTHSDLFHKGSSGTLNSFDLEVESKVRQWLKDNNYIYLRRRKNGK